MADMLKTSDNGYLGRRAAFGLRDAAKISPEAEQ